jgi:hypothetical protein
MQVRLDMRFANRVACLGDDDGKTGGCIEFRDTRFAATRFAVDDRQNWDAQDVALRKMRKLHSTKLLRRSAERPPASNTSSSREIPRRITRVHVLGVIDVFGARAAEPEA